MVTTGIGEARRCRLAISICGAGHSGSTLLGLVLGSHSRAFYAGEAKKSRFVGDESKPLRKRACKICGLDCPVWSRFVPPGEPDLYEALARLTDREAIVDSTKDADWIRDRAAECARSGTAHRLIFLQRDGRAVINSRHRKYPDEPPDALIAGWLEQIARTERLCADLGGAIRVRYELFVGDPGAAVREICDRVGLAYEPEMIEYQARAHHPLGGNTGTQSVAARGAIAAPDRSRGYYEGLAGGFRLDLRWKTELPRAVLERFEASAGEVNRPFRWGDDP